MSRAPLVLVAAGLILVGAGGEARTPGADPKAAAPAPVATDPRLVVELFAAAPDIVHPIAATVDAKGRLLVVESHTHFRPAKYDGPKHDRVRVIEDTDGDGKADRFTTFFEGTTATMDVAAHPDGSVYVATRNEILRLRDTDGDGTADEKTRVAALTTAGNYPHNGLSGLAFDSRGGLFFGLGENLGAPYQLTAADGTSVSGGGEGGSIFHCTADGRALRRVATGFWNPFGACRDIFGRLFVVDNDPDASPPCRLVHVVAGGDYGFQFRYGRSGRHPFQAWNGELPGTLPYAAGTSESPCEVVSYESDGLPAEYRGNLLVPAWADHRVERYVPAERGASVGAERRPFVQGGKDFRPSGLVVAPDGSLFVNDWVSQSYELHGKGAVWHVRAKDAKPAPRPTDPKLAVRSPHWPTREAAARTLAGDAAGRAVLQTELASADVRVRAAALTALVDAGDETTDLAAIARGDQAVGLRETAVRGLLARGADVTAFARATEPAGVRAVAVAGLSVDVSLPQLLALLSDPDPFLRHAAVQRLATAPAVLARVNVRSLTDPKLRVGVLLARGAAAAPKEPTPDLTDFLTDPDPDVRFMAVKWVADEKLVAYRPQIAAAMKNPALDPRSFLALTTALARIDGKPVNDDGLAVYFIDRLTDRTAPLSARLMALRAVPATHAKLRTDQLVDLLTETDPTFRVEALRAIKDRGDPKAAAPVRAIAHDGGQPVPVRAQAILTLSAVAPPDVAFLTDLAGGADSTLGLEALRGLYEAKLAPAQQEALTAATKARPDRADTTARVLGKPAHTERPPVTDTDAWLARLDGPADADAGRRVFENPKLATCSGCHTVDGRGAAVGPDLSLIGRTDRRWVVESVLQPSAVVAPHYLPWKIETTDGRVRTGLLVGTYLDESVYVDHAGVKFKVDARDIASANPTRTSIMPDGLLDKLTDQEVRDLVLFLTSRK